jgi:CheY-like chemotaxis protein
MTASIQCHNDPSPSGRPLHILVVDDYADAAESLAWVLHHEGFDVTAATSAAAAHAAAAAHPPDVILMDIGLPGMDGYVVAKQVRGLCPADLLLIAVTGYGGDADRRRSCDEGFDHHFVKPIDSLELTALLKEYARYLTTHR